MNPMRLFEPKITDIPAYATLLFFSFAFTSTDVYFIFQEHFTVLTLWNVSFSVAASVTVQCMVIQ